MKQGEKSRFDILQQGVKLWPHASARAIGRKLGLSHSAIFYHFGTAAQLSDAIAKHAVEMENGPVIAQLIASRHPAAKSLGPDQRAKYLATIG